MNALTIIVILIAFGVVMLFAGVALYMLVSLVIEILSDAFGTTLDE